VIGSVFFLGFSLIPSIAPAGSPYIDSGIGATPDLKSIVIT